MTFHAHNDRQLTPPRAIRPHELRYLLRPHVSLQSSLRSQRILDNSMHTSRGGNSMATRCEDQALTAPSFLVWQ